MREIAGDTNATCHLCDLPIIGTPYMRAVGDGDTRFCCHGCLQVYNIAAEIEAIATQSIELGMRLLVRLGERVPADGFVVEGSSCVDESMLTGESLPVDKRARDTVTAGTLNQQGSIIVEVQGVGDDTVVARLARMVAEAQASKASVQRFADRVAARFVPTAVAAIIGDNIGFFIGRFGGRPFIERYGKYLSIRKEQLDHVDSFFGQYGPIAVFLARFFAGARVLIALVSGTSDMRWHAFILFNALGALTWASVISAVGYCGATLGKSLLPVLRSLHLSVYAIVMLIIAVWLVIYLVRLKRMQNKHVDVPKDN